MLNTIARYEPFEPYGKAGLHKYNRSNYCSKRTVKEEFEELIAAANFSYIFLSYNNEGLMSFDEIKETMSKFGKYSVVQTNYSRFKADNNREHLSDSTIEYLHVLEK